MTIGYCEVCREGGLEIVKKCCANCSKKIADDKKGDDDS